MWFLPFLVLGAIAVAVASRSSRALVPSPSRQLPPPRSPGPPGPISVLGEILRIGKAPPPTVILCAIAEAQAIGRNDLASDIVQAFVAPAVYHHQLSRARAARSMPAYYERGSCALARSPRHPPLETVVIPSPSSIVPPADVAAPVASVAPSAASAAFTVVPAPSPASATSVIPTAAPPSIQPAVEDDLHAMLNADPVRFMELVSRTGKFPSAVAAPQASATPPPAAPDIPSSAVPTAPSPTAPAASLPSAPATALPIALPTQEAGGGADRMRALSPGSPIPGVPDFAWCAFIARLSRESPQFSSSRHVGQYRQRRERLAELGIDPAAIAGSPQAQRAALDVDLADAHQHALAGDVFIQHLGRSIPLPGREGTETITRSGVLGIIQCAGLDGAVGWLERSGDRKRYPYTTQVFLHTNGCF